jgi:hypothetical protein
LMSALFVPFAALGAFMSRLAPGAPTMRPGQYIGGVLIYVFLAAAFLCLGIGSVQAKRWARALTLVTSWYWMIAGALLTILLTAVLPVMMRSFMQLQQNSGQAQSAGISAGVIAVILTIVIVFAAFFLIAAPIAFIVFYSRQDVAETCRHRDPAERWTDRAPLPVLGASVVLAIQASFSLLAGTTTPLFPFFGRYLYGVAGVASYLIVTALDAYLAVALFRLKTTGWWLAIIATPIRVLSMALTFGRADTLQAYSRMGWSDEQMRLLSANPMFRSHVTLWWSLFSVMIFYGYLIWLKRYFRTVAPQIEGLPAQAG